MPSHVEREQVIGTTNVSHFNDIGFGMIRGSFKSKCPSARSCPLADYTAKQQAYAILLLQTKNVLICVQMGAHR